MLQSEAIDKIYPALIKALGELESVKNNAENTHFKAKYSTLSATQDIFRPVLAKHELGLVQSFGSREGKYRLITKLIHTSGQWLSDEIDLMMSKNDMQGLGSAITYGKRYMAQALLNMSGTNDDDDGNAASEKEKNKGQNQNQNQGQQKPKDQKPKGEEKPKVMAKDFKMPWGEKVKGKRLEEIDSATLEKIKSHMKELQDQQPPPENIKQVNYVYAMVKTVLLERNPPKPKDDIPENIDPKTGEEYPTDPMPDYEGESQAPKGPTIDDYVIPKGTLGLFSDIEGKPLKQVTEGELREAIKIIDAEMKKGPREGVSMTDLFTIRSKIVEFFQSMDVKL